MKAGSIEKGQYLLFQNEPYQVIEREFVNPGKGSAFTRCKIKNLLNGKVLRETLKTSEEAREADVHESDGQYLYTDGNSSYFMDAETFEQFSLSLTNIAEQQYYLHEGQQYRLLFWESQAISIILPPKVRLLVKHAPEAIKGDTVSGTTKMVECETGLRVKVPIFIKNNDHILVNTDTGEYVERVK